MAGYSHRTVPWTICRSVGRSVSRSVSLSSALCKNGGLDPDAVWRHRSDGSIDEAGSGVWGSVHGKGYFCGRIWGAPLYLMGTLRRTCATVPQPSELEFTVVREVGQGIAVLHGGPHCARERGGLEVLFSIFTMGNAIGSPTVKYFRFICENLTTFPLGKRIVGKLDSWAFWRYIQFQDQRRRL